MVKANTPAATRERFTEAGLLRLMDLGELLVCTETLTVRLWHRSYRRWIVKRPEQHERTGRYRFKFGPDRRKVYRNRLVFIWVHRRVPAGRVDHIDGDRFNDFPHNLQEHTSYESNAQGMEVLMQRNFDEAAAFFDSIGANNGADQG